VYYEKLLGETEDGERGMFHELLRMQYLQEYIAYEQSVLGMMAETGISELLVPMGSHGQVVAFDSELIDPSLREAVHKTR
jgi:hypothetical protein